MKTLKLNTRAVIPVITFAVGILWVVYGLKNYGWWDEGPASGFFPSIVGIILAGISIIAFLEGVKLPAPEYIKASWYPFIAAFATVGMAMIIGFFPAMFLYLEGWLKIYEKYSWKRSLPISIITTAALYGYSPCGLWFPFPPVSSLTQSEVNNGYFNFTTAGFRNSPIDSELSGRRSGSPSRLGCGRHARNRLSGRSGTAPPPYIQI